MAMDVFPLGMRGKLYRNTGTYQSPIWNPVENVKDVTLTMSANEADVTTRAGGGFVQSLPTTTAIEVTFQMLSQTGDLDLDAIKTAFFNKTDIEIACMNGPITEPDARGIRFTGRVYTFTRNEALADAQSFDVSIKPGPALHPVTSAYLVPEWITGTAP